MHTFQAQGKLSLFSFHPTRMGCSEHLNMLNALQVVVYIDASMMFCSSLQRVYVRYPSGTHLLWNMLSYTAGMPILSVKFSYILPITQESRILSHFLSPGLASNDVLFTFQGCGGNKHHNVRTFHQQDSNVTMLGSKQDAEPFMVLFFIFLSPSYNYIT